MNQAYDLEQLRARCRRLLNKDRSEQEPVRAPMMNQGLWAVPLIEELSERIKRLEERAKPRRNRKRAGAKT